MAHAKWMGLVLGAAAVVACSGQTASTGGKYDGCLSSMVGSACLACIQSNCGAALSSIESGCSDYLDCSCPGGAFSASNAGSQTCMARAGESSCTSATSSSSGSACAACDSQCSTGFGSGGTGSSGGTTGSGSGSSGGTSSSGGTTSSGGGSGSSSGSTVGCTSDAPPGTALQSVSLSLTGVDFGDATATEWQGIGWNLDGKCTTAASTDVCTLVTGAAKQTQTDGSGGIDNSYGANICAIMDATAGAGACSKIQQAFLQTDETGAGTLTLPGGGGQSVSYPVRDVYVQASGGGGIVGGVMPTAGVVAAMQSVAACISTSLCGSAFQSIATQLEQASDIQSDGSNAPGSTCDGISFGLKFTGSTTVSSVPAPTTCPCP